MNIGPVVSVGSLGAATGIFVAATTPGSAERKFAQIGGWALAGVGTGALVDGIVRDALAEALVGVALTGLGVVVALKGFDAPIRSFRNPTTLGFVGESGKKKWVVIHSITEGNDPRPVLEHRFYGETPEEARHVYDAHLKSDRFLAQCDKLGLFDGRVQCKSKARLQKLT